MARNGSGVYSPPSSSFNPAVNGQQAQAADWNTLRDDISTALTQSIASDGQTTPTANLPMGGFKHTNVAVGSSRTDYASFGQSQDGKLNWVDGGGTADAITANYTVAISSLVDGQLCFVRATAANTTTTPTFAPNGLTARTIVRFGGQALVAGSIYGDGHELILRYDLTNTRWELLNPAVTGFVTLAGSNTVTANNTFSGTNSFTGTTSVTSNIAISGNSTEAAYVTLAEDTDNGTNKVKLQAPASLASDITLTLPSSSGTLVTSTGVAIVAVSYVETTSASSISSTIPYDDTIPQISEGTQILSLAHTAVSGTNKLDILLTVQGVNSAGASCIVAVFKDSDVNAVAAGFWNPANESYAQTFSFRVTAGDTSSHTYTVRLGTTSGTFTLNGTGGARRLGGVCVTSMKIQEVTA